MRKPSTAELSIRFLVALVNEGGEVKRVPEELQPMLEWCMHHGFATWDFDYQDDGDDPSVTRITDDGRAMAELYQRVLELPEPQEPEEDPEPTPGPPAEPSKPKDMEW